MKLINCKGIVLTAISWFALSCNQSAPVADKKVEMQVVEPAPVKEDSTVTLVRPILVINETKDIQLGGFHISSLDISNIRVEKISMKSYFQTMAEDLRKLMHLSTDKEKTASVISNLQSLAARSSNEPEVFKVFFHLSAQAGKTVYNEDHIKYLSKDLIELKRNSNAH